MLTARNWLLQRLVQEVPALQVLLLPGSGQVAPNCSACWLSISGSDKLLHEPDSVQVLGTYFNIVLTHVLVSGSGLFSFAVGDFQLCSSCCKRAHRLD